MTRCPSERTLLESLFETVRPEAGRHIATCAACTTRRDVLKSDLTMVRAALMSARVPDTSAARRRSRRVPVFATAAATMAAVSIAWLILATGGRTPATPTARVDTDRLLATLSASMFDSSPGMTAVWGSQAQTALSPDGCEWGLVVRCTETLSGRALGQSSIPELSPSGFGTREDEDG